MKTWQRLQYITFTLSGIVLNVGLLNVGPIVPGLPSFGAHTEEEEHDHEEDAGQSVEQHAETHVHAGEAQTQDCHSRPGFSLDIRLLITLDVSPLQMFRMGLRRRVDVLVEVCFAVGLSYVGFVMLESWRARLWLAAAGVFWRDV